MRTIYGINPVTEAIRAGKNIDHVIVSAARNDKTAAAIMKAATDADIEVRRAPEEELRRLTKTDKHQGVAAVLAEEFRYSAFEDLIAAWKESGEQAFFLILDSIQDPQNLGSLVRTANAAGVHGVIIPKDRASEVTSTVVKTSAGATEVTPVARETNLTRAIERLKEEGVWVAAVEGGSSETVYSADLDRDIAIVIGSEGRGIRRLVKESCDFCVSIPMYGEIGSLNAAQAGAVALFEARRQRLKAK
ncbi:MAG: 23S rRNA (guanosine(2251)-2'-O)-methyltransferase RlmB [Deltaproteobacteria bacterium]|nr:23S rRNA (guanosine(2251)-2'-O)-methyltransferase RlmB [Deltaproteobacteria bacterium]